MKYGLKMAAASALARFVTIGDLFEDCIIPGVLDKNGETAVAKSVAGTSF
jgi:malic enzyme